MFVNQNGLAKADEAAPERAVIPIICPELSYDSFILKKDVTRFFIAR